MGKQAASGAAMRPLNIKTRGITLMGRKVFKEKGITAAGNVLSLDTFVPFTGRGPGQSEGLYIHPAYVDGLIKDAENLAGKKYTTLLASDYMRFREDGDRDTYEHIYLERRRDLMTLFAAEMAEGRGRFVKPIIDLVWMICDESTWVFAAHNLIKPGDTGALPYCVDAEYEDAVDFIDLFSAATGADLAIVVYYLGDKFDAYSRSVSARVKHELSRRILKPVIDRRNHKKMFWLGKYGPVNNWCPWVISNILTTAAFVEQDVRLREDIVQISLDALDVFTSMYSEEGSCDEGPVYWTVAAGSLFNALGVLFDMSGGKINVYGDPLIRNMFEFISRVSITRKYPLCFADSPVRVNLRSPWMYEMGLKINSGRLASFAAYLLSARGSYTVTDPNKPYIALRQLALDPAVFESAGPYSAKRLDYMSDLKIAVSRESEDPAEGLYLAFKGGHNAEGHNHNDVGEIVVFKDSRPVFVDVGSGTYTARSFNEKRYDILALRSEYHNTPTVNGKTQPQGGRYRSKNECWDPETGALSMDVSDAYPGSGLVSYVRTAFIEDSHAVITECPVFSGTGFVEYNYMCVYEPSVVSPGRITVGNAVMEYDPELTVRIETVDFASQPETVGIPSNWRVENVYRIVLGTPVFEGARTDTVRIG